MTETQPLFNGLQILKATNGYYIGLTNADGSPYSRESDCYYSTFEEADLALKAGLWPDRSGPEAAPFKLSCAMRAAAMIAAPDTKAKAYQQIRQLMFETSYGPRGPNGAERKGD